MRAKLADGHNDAGLFRKSRPNPGCSTSSSFRGGPRVRIHLPPAVSLVRTGPGQPAATTTLGKNVAAESAPCARFGLAGVFSATAFLRTSQCNPAPPVPEPRRGRTRDRRAGGWAGQPDARRIRYRKSGRPSDAQRALDRVVCDRAPELFRQGAQKEVVGQAGTVTLQWFREAQGTVADREITALARIPERNRSGTCRRKTTLHSVKIPDQPSN
jgi:hypothetical protein